MSSTTRDRILDALRTVLATGGSDAATLENVAAEAGVSKGGLLYHFPTKQDMFRGLLDRTRQSAADHLGSLDSKDDVVRAFLEYSAPRNEEERGFMTGLIASLRGGSDGDDEYPVSALLADMFATWEDPIRQAVDDPVTAEIIMQVGNGLYLGAVCGLRAPDPSLVRQLVDRLVSAAH